LDEKVGVPLDDLFFERKEITDKSANHIVYGELVLDKNPDNHKIPLVRELLDELIEKDHQLVTEFFHVANAEFFVHFDL